MENVSGRTPVHLWIVGGLATLWNAFGCFDYFMTRTRGAAYIESMMHTADGEAIMAYINAFPIWAAAGWGLGVWGGLAGAILLLLRSRYAVHAFAVSLLGMALSFGYQNFGGSKMPAGMDEGVHKYMPLVIIAIGVALLWFARSMRGKGVLR